MEINVSVSRVSGLIKLATSMKQAAEKQLTGKLEFVITAKIKNPANKIMQNFEKKT